ncbi:MAG: gliding motility-associated C-terminal domain-containing protein [Paludibacteraceae bacterium]|nr:gliding motility-associated C-terminal domain-containing protein [Paludibacteraceae bacterium]
MIKTEIQNSAMLKRAKFRCVICLLLFLLSSVKVSARDVGAPNIDFSDGNFNGWTMETGSFYRQADSTCTYEWTSSVTRENDRFKLIDAAISSYDPIISCDEFKQNPFSDGAITMRIGTPGYGSGAEGNGTVKAAAERATYKFVVTEESKALILNFACVLHDPVSTGPNARAEHSGEQIPHFGMNVEFKSPSGVVSTEACASFESTANKTATYLKQPTVPCAYSSDRNRLSNYAYLPWTSTIYDLTNKVGYEVTITFMTHDCLRVQNNKEGAGGHEAYGYFYAETTDLVLDVNNCESSGENATIKAPKGFAHYEWKVDGNDSPMFIFNGADSSEVEIDRRLMTSNSKYTCTMRGELASCSSITLETELLPVSVKPDIKFNVGCSGFVEFTNASTLNTTDDELFKYNWDFGDGHNSVLENTEHTYTKYGNYKVKLTAVTKHGCSGTDSFNVTIPDYPTVIIDGQDTVCQGATVELFAQNISQNSTVTWMDSSKTIISNDFSTKVTIDNSSWFYVHVVDDLSCGYDDSLYINRVLMPNIKLSATKDTVCSGDSTRITASSLVSCTYAWSNGKTGSRVQVIPTQTQTYKCQAISLNFGCIAEDSIKIHVNPSPIVDLWAPDELCSGERSNVYGIGAENYEWDLGKDPLSGQDIVYSGPSMEIMPYSDTSYTVIGYDKYGCKGTASRKVRIKQSPLVQIADLVDEVCPDEQAKVSMLSAQGYTFEWQDGSTNSTLQKKIKENEIWKVKVSLNGCTDSMSVPVYVFQLPLVAILSKDEVCALDTVKLSVVGTPDRIEWIYPPAGSDSVAFDIPDGPTEYQVVGYSVEGCPNPVTKIVNVNIPVQVDIIAPDSVCVGNKAELAFQGNVESQRWYAGDTYFDFQKETSFLVREPVWIKLESTDKNGCKSKDSTYVDTIARPIIEIVGDFEVCPGEAAKVDAVGAIEYEWHDGVKGAHRAFKINEETLKVTVTGSRKGCVSQASAILGTLPVPELWVDGDSVVCPGKYTSIKAHGAATYNWGYGLDGESLEVSPSVPTKYTLTGIGDNGCQSTKVVTVSLREVPNVTITGDINVCKDSVATIVASGAMDYSWKHGKQGETLVEKITGETTFEVIGVDSFGCENTASFTILPVDPPVLSYLGSVDACKGEYVHLRAQGATTFEWYYGNDTVYTPNLDFIPESDMYVKLVGTRLNCSSDMNIFIHQLTPPNVLITGDKIVCPGDKATITASGAKSYKWNTNEVGPTITQYPMLTTTYYVTGTDDNGCTNTVPYELDVYKLPKLDIKLSSVEGCADEGDKVRLSASGAIFYEWSAEPEPEDLSANYNSESMEIAIFADTKFTLVGRDENGCVSSTYKSVTLANRRTFDFSVTPGWIDETNPTVQFVGLSPVEAEWTWQPYSTAQELKGRTMNYRYETEKVGDSVSVLVRAVDAAGCVYEGVTSLYVWKDIWAPEAFTPNGDEKNDGFRFYGGRYVDEFSYIIYNRLGEIMYEGRGMEDSWDGKWNGKECPWGVYGWVYKYKCKFGNLERDGENRGFVTLVR